MTTTPRTTSTERSRMRRKHEKAWLKSQGFNSWEALHTALMNGTIALDRVTPAYRKPSIIDQALSHLEVQAEYQKLINPKKEQS